MEVSDRLKKIDALYARGLGRYIDLPQIDFYGDQSSGKSSVVEAVTELPFPRNAGLCTRFPTQVIFERAAQPKIQASVIKADGEIIPITEIEGKDGTELGSEGFLKLFNEACEKMKLPKPGEFVGGREGSSTFSDSTFRVKVCAPDKEHFSVIDLPGLFRRTTDGETTEEDMKFVRDLIEDRMKNPQGIINYTARQVVPANVDLATQEILEMSLRHDKDQERTITVLTKPDLVDKGTEDRIIELIIKNQYNVVCNRSQMSIDTPLKERNDKEQSFFDSEPWSKLPKHLTGVDSLKKKINTVLNDVANRRFLKVVADIQEQVYAVQKEISVLGENRESTDQQRSFLLKLSSNFQNVTSNAVDAAYSRSKALRNTSDLKLATLMAHENDNFERAMREQGHTFAFSTDKGADGDKPSHQESETQSNILPSSTGISEKLKDITDLKNYPELSTLLEAHQPEQSLEENIMEWIQEEHASCRGYGVGITNPTLPPSLFTQQSVNWKAIAQTHITAMTCIIHNYIKTLLENLCNIKEVHQRIWRKLLPLLKERYEEARKQVEFYFGRESGGRLYTLNQTFAQNLENARTRRGGKTDHLHKTTFTSNIESEVQDLHDVLETYYNLARQRFVDAVCLDAVDHYLISGPESPLKIFSPEYIGKLDCDSLEDIAGDREATRNQRRALEEKLKSLREGQKILAG